MQRAEALLEIIHERGKRGLPLERLYRHLFNPELYLLCLREDLPQRRRYDTRRQRGDRGRHEPEEDPGDHRGAAA